MIEANRTKARTTAFALLTRYGGAGAQERATAKVERAARLGDTAVYRFWWQVVEDIADLRTKQQYQRYVLSQALRKHDRR